MILEFLCAFVGAVLETHGAGPDASGDTTHDGVFGIHAVREKEAQVRREIVDVHTTRQIRLDEGKTVGQRKGELADRVRARFGDVIAGDRYRIEIPDLVLDEIGLDIGHHLQRKFGREDAGVLPLVFFQDVGLHCAAHGLQRPRPDLLDLFIGRGATVIGLEPGDLLVGGGVHEHRQYSRCRPVDGHRNGCRRAAQIEAVIQRLHVVERRDGDAGVADLAVNVGPFIRIETVKRDAVECGRQALGV